MILCWYVTLVCSPVCPWYLAVLVCFAVPAVGFALMYDVDFLGDGSTGTFCVCLWHLPGVVFSVALSRAFFLIPFVQHLGPPCTLPCQCVYQLFFLNASLCNVYRLPFFAAVSTNCFVVACFESCFFWAIAFYNLPALLYDPNFQMLDPYYLAEV